MDRREFLGATAGAAVLAATAKPALAQNLPLGDLPGTRYPDAHVEVIDKRFRKVGNTAVERIATGCRWAEGPAYFRDGGYLLWSDIANNRIMRWSEDDGHVSVFRQPSNYSNGNTRDREGRLLTCEHDTRRVTRTEHDGSITVLMDSFMGKPLNAPNDIVVAADGAVWFTDPGFGNAGNYEGHKVDFQLPPQVYRLNPQTKAATVVYTNVPGRGPNGLCFSPDEKKLYVVESGTPGIAVFDVQGDKLANRKVFTASYTNSNTDSVRCDTEGNVWASAASGDAGEDGVHCFAPDGTLLGKIHLPESCANFCFGGKKKNRLFMCASTSVYSVYVDYVGALVP